VCGLSTPENAHTLADPVLDDVAQRQPEVRHGTFGMEVHIDDIFVTS